MLCFTLLPSFLQTYESVKYESVKYESVKYSTIGGDEQEKKVSNVWTTVIIELGSGKVGI